MFFKLRWTQPQRLEKYSMASTVQTHTLRLAVFVLPELQRPIRLRDGCDEFVKNKMIDITLAVSKHGWGFHSSTVIDKALSENVSSSADLPVDKDAAWDWDWSIPKLPTRHGYDGGTLFREVKKYYPLGYIVNFLFASQACTLPRYRNKKKCAANIGFKKKKRSVIFICGFETGTAEFWPSHTSVWTNSGKRHVVHMSGFVI